jgi:hypothetical protein
MTMAMTSRSGLGSKTLQATSVVSVKHRETSYTALGEPESKPDPLAAVCWPRGQTTRSATRSNFNFVMKGGPADDNNERLT